ncbi:MAG: hypothetical protein QW815_06965, partial [Nitrososphaerota archaeon]
LVNLLVNEVPEEVRQAAGALKHNIVHTVNIGLKGTELGVGQFMHWVYYPEGTTIFHRVSFPHHFSEWMVPNGCCSIQAEVSESIYRPVDRSTLIEGVLRGLVRVGILTEKEARPVSEGGRVQVAKVVTLNPAYIIYDLKHRENTQRLKEYLRKFQIETRGRFGEWEYFNMDHAILSGKAVAESIGRA